MVLVDTRAEEGKRKGDASPSWFCHLSVTVLTERGCIYVKVVAANAVKSDGVSIIKDWS